MQVTKVSLIPAAKWELEQFANIECLQTEEACYQYLADESKLRAKQADAVYFPRQATELSAILYRNNQAGVSSTVSGARTGIAGGAVPLSGGTLISLSKLKYITKVESEQGRAVLRLGAGVSLEELNQYLRENLPDYMFPVDPTETWASIGGMVSTNASGSRSYAFGPVKSWVKGLRLVLPSGEILELSRGQYHFQNGNIQFDFESGLRELHTESIPKPPTKHALAYCLELEMDLIDLFIGAEGTLGVISDVEIELIPKPEVYLCCFQLLKDWNTALAYVDRLRELKQFGILSIEFLDARALAFAASSPKLKGSNLLGMLGDVGTQTAVFAEVGLKTEEELESFAEHLGNLQEMPGVGQSFVAMTEKDIREIKAFRHAVSEMVNALIAKRKESYPDFHKVGTDMAVPKNTLAEMYSIYESYLSAAGLDFTIYGHIGDAHLHVNILPRNSEELAEAKRIYLRFAKEAVRLGGAVAAEHGIGRMKKDFLKVQYAEQTINAMKAVKRFFDPQWLLNSGVLFDE